MLIDLAPCPVPAVDQPRLDGQMCVVIEPGTRTASIYGGIEAVEEFHCSYGLRPEKQHLFEDAALRIVGRAEDDTARIVEITPAPFFIATLFLPQLAPDQPHPLIRAFVATAAVPR
jgi:CTP synthase (UTP-ammonia lyase)